MPSSPKPLVSSPITRSRTRWAFLHRHKSVKVDDTPNSPPICCCFRRRTAAVPRGRNVHFSKTIEADPSAPTDLANRGGTPKLVRRRSRSTRRSDSRRSFLSAVSSYSAVKRLRQTDQLNGECSTREPSITSAPTVRVSCVCAFPAHMCFNSTTPILPPPDAELGSYAELLIHAKAQLGNWTTILSRSDSLEPQMVHVGISKMKRMVMNRLAIPFTAVLEQNDTRLHCWITTPVGAKHTTADLTGAVTEDKDADLGDWSATTSMVDYPVEWFCGGKTVRALQMKRLNSKLGVAYETRVCLPDKEEGRVLLYNITIEPADGKPTIRVDRIYKFVSA